MAWTKQVPIRPGWYWWRSVQFVGSQIDAPEAVEAVLFDHELFFYYGGGNAPLNADDLWWDQPIVDPPEVNS